MGTLYKTAKIFHLTGLVLWLGPSTGGYILLLLARYRHEAPVEAWLFKEYLNLIHLEAFGLATLVCSGLAMRLSMRALGTALWLKRKLFIVFPVFIPFEALQLYIYHSVVKRAFLTGAGVAEAIALYDRFSIISFVILGVSVPVVFYLAVFRPGFNPRNPPLT